MSATAVDTRDDRLATTAIVASVLGLVVPVVAPVVGVSLGLHVLWRRRGRAPDEVGAQATIAVVVGVATIALPLVVVGTVMADDWTVAPLIAVAVIGVAVVVAALRLGGVGGGTAAVAVTGTVAGVSALAFSVIAAVLAIGWVFVLLVRTFVGALFGFSVPVVG